MGVESAVESAIDKIFVYVKIIFTFVLKFNQYNKFMKVRFLTLFMFMLGWCFTPLMAQTLSVKGTVTDENKVPLPGVSVFNKKHYTRGKY